MAAKPSAPDDLGAVRQEHHDALHGPTYRGAFDVGAHVSTEQCTGARSRPLRRFPILVLQILSIGLILDGALLTAQIRGTDAFPTYSFLCYSQPGRLYCRA
ncbi:hypothetical protein MAXJ12_31562 [Mesorhizobium alhagi CCNWXJ12-2]|uniref:Uncharacterized protein n=1 Tax=Mesorhizobium alhagi CCNWXJ12-2 TaxID=1107882 RepID=H0I1H5_9HYPH|nr:hypothetical protein MAXJ12_31562 [Mesorhizobium alhagi CCNWXJ12-2]